MNRANEAVRHVVKLTGISQVQMVNLIGKIYDPNVDESFFCGLFAGINVRPSISAPLRQVDRVNMISNGALVFAIAHEMGFCLDKYISSVCLQPSKKIEEKCPRRVLLEMILGFAIASLRSGDDQTDMVLRVMKIKDVFCEISDPGQLVGFLADDMEAFRLCVGVLAEEPVARMLFSKILHDEHFIRFVNFKEILDIIADIYSKKYLRRLAGHEKVDMAKRFFD